MDCQKKKGQLPKSSPKFLQIIGCPLMFEKLQNTPCRITIAPLS